MKECVYSGDIVKALSNLQKYDFSQHRPAMPSVTKGPSIKGKGHVAWSFADTKGMLRTVKVPAYYISPSFEHH